MSVSTQIHGSCVSLEGRGVLLIGASGSGKSDLCLRLMEAGAMLVADDRVILEACGNDLWARAPERLAGLIEARGVGILTVSHEAMAPVALVVAAEPEPERYPELEQMEYCGVCVPLLRLNFLHDSARAKIRLWITSSQMAVHLRREAI